MLTTLNLSPSCDHIVAESATARLSEEDADERSTLSLDAEDTFLDALHRLCYAVHFLTSITS